jgi:hypothetical protein
MEARDQAYHALQVAAERMGHAAYLAQLGTRRRLRQFVPTQEHRDICQAMSDVWAGRITPAEAMGMLWQYDVMRQRGVA